VRSNPEAEVVGSTWEREWPAPWIRRSPMAQSAGYGRNWKKWLAIYVAVAAVAYLIVYLVFFANGSGSP
jgi:hypothetical protein